MKKGVAEILENTIQIVHNFKSNGKEAKLFFRLFSTKEPQKPLFEEERIVVVNPSNEPAQLQLIVGKYKSDILFCF